eukprot:scaffold12295_cov129-Ochromonas_danica.AAC.1
MLLWNRDSNNTIHSFLGNLQRSLQQQLRALAAKHSIGGGVLLLQGPLEIAKEGVNGVVTIAIPQEHKTVDQAVDFICAQPHREKTVYVFYYMDNTGADFDIFVSYSGSSLEEEMKKLALAEGPALEQNPTIDGIQCKRTRGYPKYDVHHGIRKGWFLRGGETVVTKMYKNWPKWLFPSEDFIKANIL